MDKLFMSCLADRFTVKQLSNPMSQLSKNGRKIAGKLGNLLNIPVYYFLQDKWSNNIKNSWSGFYLRDVCPVCGEHVKKS